MREIDKIISKIEEHIKNGTYAKVETDKFELKSLSASSDWKELYKTTCAFLNTRGGIIVIGIKEDISKKKYIFTSFDKSPGNEDKLKDLPKVFKNDNGEKIDLSEFIRADLFEINSFLDGNVCIIFIEKLPDEGKYVFYESDAYERRITGDHRIPQDKIQKQRELKEELKKATELEFIPNTTIEDFDLAKLNEYIYRLNKDIEVETLKPDLESAKSFLSRKKFIREDNPTLLGILVCGKHPYDKVGGRCEADCYFETGIEIATDKKVLKDNIISLMESAVNYTFSKISTGISAEKGGTTLFEYPEKVIRETINNALAHRDYKSDRFNIIKIANNLHIEIRNPGRFKQEQLLVENSPKKLRRIIPIPKAINPNLADILKSFDRWEGRGLGMSSLTNYALNNKIDIPFYRLYNENEIGLFIPKGKVLDEKMNSWLNSFNKFILNNTKGKELNIEQKTVLAYLYKSEVLNEEEKFTVNLTPDNNHFEVIGDLITWDLIKELNVSSTVNKIYIVNQNLLKAEFSIEMREVFGGAYDSLNNDMKEILEAIYQHNEYSTVKDVSANLISNFLYFKTHNTNVIDINELGNFKRKIRYAINKLEKNGFIKRKFEGKPNYEINKSFEREISMFDNR